MVTLEHLQRRHDRARTPAIAGARRKQARDLAASLNIPVPEWAQERDRFRGGRPRLHGRDKRVFGRGRSAAPVVTTHAVRAVTLDALLSEWRRANPGAIMRVHAAGVSLYPYGAPAVHYPTTEAALEALTRP
jgi:hypothetical protein